MPGALLGPFGRYELGAEIVTIGRSSANKLVINDTQVSGRHLQVLPQGTDYLLVDIGSSNGTTLNGQRLTPQAPQPLRSGDVIVIGNTRLTIELAASAFPATQGQAQQGEIIFAPTQQAGGFPPAPEDPVFPPFPPAQAAPPFGGPIPQAAPFPPAAPAPQGVPFPPFPPAPQGSPFPSAAPQAAPFPPPTYGAQPPQGAPFAPAAPTPQGLPFPPAGPPQGAPFPSAGQGPTVFGPPTGDAPGQAPVFQPNAGGPWAAPPAYGGAPGVGVGLPPASARAHRNRKMLLIGAVVALVVILGATTLIFLKFTGGNQSTVQGTATPAIAQQVIMPFYQDLEKQDFNAATGLFTSTLLQEHGGAAGWTRIFQSFDQLRGKITAFTIDPPSGSGNTRMAQVKVTRDPTKGMFKPDTVVLLYQQGKWQINDWVIGSK